MIAQGTHPPLSGWLVSARRASLWGSYKDSSGHIGIMRWGAPQNARVVEKRDKPQAVAGLPLIASIASGAHHTLALAENGGCFSWG